MNITSEVAMEANYHRHKCKFCGFVWEHHNCNDKSHGDYGAHECPGCHRCNWEMGVYDGSDPPQIRNGRVPPVAPEVN